MSSLEALAGRVGALEALVGERDARITALETALSAAEAKVAASAAAPAVCKKGGDPAPGEAYQGNAKTKVVDDARALEELDNPYSGKWTSEVVRSSFIGFFADQHEHKFWKSSPCVPHDDPTLLFTNAGMNQFKPLFLGTCDPTSQMFGMKRATNSQKCIRAGGKHNDLDDVGKDVYHHTYFEMLGNWSFGDYFKEGAIDMAWRCLTEVFKLDPARLYVTYFGGDEVKAPGVPSDEETRQLWLKYVPADHLLPFDAADNFWEMGDVGPCGPCTEIHYDRIGGRDASHLVNMDDPMVLEIWNNVFIQYNRDPDGLKQLPAQHVDTGMGFERLASILQEKTSNYNTDVFLPLFTAIQRITACPHRYTGRVSVSGVAPDDGDQRDMAYRVIADHIRTLSFAIADGARPDSVGRGYVLRRILRRAVYFGRFLGVHEGAPFFSELVQCVVDTYGGFFEELGPAQEKITRVIRDEEAQFNRTIAQGMKVFAKEAGKVAASGQSELPGDVAFLLSGSMGFPLDLTEIMCEARGMTVDKRGYDKAVELEKAGNLKKGGADEKDMTMQSKETALLVGKGLQPTDQSAKYGCDLSASESQVTAVVQAIFTGRGGLPSEKGFVEAVRAASSGDGGEDVGLVGLVLDQTSFYAQGGGQVWDTGVLSSPDGAVKVSVSNVQAYAGFVVHVGTVVSGEVTCGARLTCEVDHARRGLVVPNHTITHVLNHALREVLMGGPNEEEERAGKLNQKGSDVNAERLRFDFAWDEALTKGQLSEVERLVNAQIQDKDYAVYDAVVPLEDAKQIHGLRAVFGEAYPDPVRVVSVGKPVDELLADPDNSEWRQFSVEFCGGTHLAKLGAAERFVITEESSTSAGVRRVTAVTRAVASEAASHGAQLLASVALAEATTDMKGKASMTKALKLGFGELGGVHVRQVDKYEAMDKVSALEKVVAAHKKALLKEVEASSKAAADAWAAGLDAGAVAATRIDFGDNGKLNSALQKSLGKGCTGGSFLVVSYDEDGGKVCVYAGVDKKISAGVDAFKWCEAALAPLGYPSAGKCGGKDKNAMGSAPASDAAAADAVLAAAQAFAASL